MLYGLRTAVAVFAAAVATCSNATPISYQFTVAATDGPLAGISSTGSFSYDDSSITPGAFNDAVGLLVALDFTWNGIHYNQSTANTGQLWFRGDGRLIWPVFGNSCSPGTCVAIAGSEQWFVNGLFFDYSVAGANSVFTGTVTTIPPLVPGSSISEPASVALLCVLLATALAARRRARSSL